ncbi:hypothetical protein [Amycolatopsis sp. cmx-4-61]|uniref:hypothetical protein n=1 Tax=Amycolatopsis sp. cmx-4-61 TaxID=2790937 RepID=UPI003978F931
MSAHDRGKAVPSEQASSRSWWPWLVVALLLGASATSWFLAPQKYGLRIGMLLLAGALTVNQLIAWHRSRGAKAEATPPGPTTHF